MLENALKICNGCHTCYSVCPKQAIKMVLNDDDFLYSNIDGNLCVKCGLCEKKIMPWRKRDVR